LLSAFICVISLPRHKTFSVTPTHLRLWGIRLKVKNLTIQQKVGSKLTVADTTKEGKTTFKVGFKTYVEETT